jgi:hypothetical protein
MKTSRRASLLVLALLATDAATGDEQGMAALDHATPCCGTLAELRYDRLAADRAGLFDVGEESPMFVFDTGRSFVLAVELPPLEPPYTVQVRSYLVGGAVQRSEVFYPAAILLDADHQVLARLEAEDLPVVKTSYGDAARENRWGLPLRLQWDILIERPEAKYLVIHTTGRALATRSITTTREAIPVILPGVVTALPGKKHEVGIQHSPLGRLALQVVR